MLGLGVRAVGSGAASAVGGDALYAVLVYVLVALVAPRARPTVVAGVAWGLCAAVELAQLAGLSGAVVDAWEPARWVLGTTFHAPDLLVYALGAGVAAAVDVVVHRGAGEAVHPREGSLPGAGATGGTPEVSPRSGTAATSSPRGPRDRPPRRGLPSSRS